MPPGVESLTELALDLHWAWNHRSDELWALLAPDLWAATHNPWVMLQTVSRARLKAFLAQPEQRARVERLLEHRRHRLAATAWFKQSHPDTPLNRVAYLSMEFALSEALPVYSGGLGNVAGDQLKAACDLDVPVVGVGLLYQQGYFRQVIRPDGSQQALYPCNDPGQLPTGSGSASARSWRAGSPSFPITTCSWPNTWCRVSICGSIRRAGPGKPAARAA